MPFDSVPEKGLITNVYFEASLFRFYFFFVISWLLAQESAELLKVNVTILVSIVFSELFLVFARIHLNFKSLKCIEAASFCQTVLFSLLVKSLALIENFFNLFFSDICHLFFVFFELLTVV